MLVLSDTITDHPVNLPVCASTGLVLGRYWHIMACLWGIKCVLATSRKLAEFCFKKWLGARSAPIHVLNQC